MALVNGKCSLSVSGVKHAPAWSCRGVFTCRRHLTSAGSHALEYGMDGDGDTGLFFQLLLWGEALWGSFSGGVRYWLWMFRRVFVVLCLMPATCKLLAR